MLARYTPAEARALESHYIACAKREGIWGMGKLPPSSHDKARSAEAGTAAGIARQQRKERNKLRVMDAMRNGIVTARGISQKLQLSDNCIRRYLRELSDDGFADVAETCERSGIRKWRALNHVRLAKVAR